MGSCGVGVIMVVKDLIVNGLFSVNNFKWKYCEMYEYRRDLML